MTAYPSLPQLQMTITFVQSLLVWNPRHLSCAGIFLMVYFLPLKFTIHLYAVLVWGLAGMLWELVQIHAAFI